MPSAGLLSTSAAPDTRAEALLASFERAGYGGRAGDPAAGGAVPRPLRRGHPQAHVPHDRSAGTRAVPAARPPSRPVSRHYLASPAAGKPPGFCYLGPVFRHRDAGAGEFLQAGIESFARPDTAAADADARARARRHGTLRSRGGRHPDRRRCSVRRAHRGARSRARLEAAPDQGFQPQDIAGARSRSARHRRPHARPEYQGVLAALAGSDPKAAHALVTDLLSIAGITTVGGRSVGEIADRFREQAALGADLAAARNPGADRKIPRDPRRSRRGRGRPAPLRATPASSSTPRSICSRTARAFSPRAASISPASGFPPPLAVVSITIPASCSSCTIRSGGGPTGGGRTLRWVLARLGSAGAISAVGFAVWIERLAALRERS